MKNTLILILISILHKKKTKLSPKYFMNFVIIHSSLAHFPFLAVPIVFEFLRDQKYCIKCDIFVTLGFASLSQKNYFATLKV